VHADFSFFYEDLTFLMIIPGRCRRCRTGQSHSDRNIQEDMSCDRCLLPEHSQSFFESSPKMSPLGEHIFEDPDLYSSDEDGHGAKIGQSPYHMAHI
jgi:hypothetical protein